MKTQFKNSVNKLTLIFLLSITVFVFGFGCNTSKPSPNTLAGRTGGKTAYEGCSLDKAIVDDYLDLRQR